MLYTALYLAIVWAGPRLMKNREPFRLTWALIPYNLSMAALNLYIASEVSDWCSTSTYRLGNSKHTNEAYLVSRTERPWVRLDRMGGDLQQALLR
jgi:hypothetical protein